MKTKGAAEGVLEKLESLYPDACCSLDFENPFQLLVATILSAQCTDERVNKVTPALFERCPGPEDMASVRAGELEELIRSTGFYRNKAKSLLGAARMLSDEYGGRVPDAMDDLLKLPGVARKTANVVLGNAYGKSEGIVVDTHVKRLSGRMGLSRAQTPEQIERDLMACFPKEKWTFVAHAMIQHGRRVCVARNPACEDCGMKQICPRKGV